MVLFNSFKAIYDTKWKCVKKQRLDADDLQKIESAEIIEGQWGPQVRFNMKSGGWGVHKLSPRMDFSKFPIGTKLELTSLALCTLSKPGADNVENIEIDGGLKDIYANE